MTAAALDAAHQGLRAAGIDFVSMSVASTGSRPEPSPAACSAVRNA